VTAFGVVIAESWARHGRRARFRLVADEAGLQFDAGRERDVVPLFSAVLAA
jgi:hypothetical protein